MKKKKVDKISLKDKNLKMPCPVCGSKLMQLTSALDDLVIGYKGLVYCTDCDYEVGKDEFDRKYKNHE